MLETALVAFTMFFATIGPIDTAAFFAALTPGMSRRERRILAIKACAIATGLLLLFVAVGDTVLGLLGVSLSALKAAGGVLLLLIAIDMVFARPSGATSATEPETKDAATRQDIAVFPLATPLIAGPGAMSGAIILTADAAGDPAILLVIVLALLAVMVLTLAFLLAAAQVHDFIGVTPISVIARVLGILLAAVAVQFLFDGLAGSGLFGPASEVVPGDLFGE